MYSPPTCVTSGFVPVVETMTTFSLVAMGPAAMEVEEEFVPTMATTPSLMSW